jgi:hypothetical protein
MELNATVMSRVCAEIERARSKHREFPGNNNPVRSAGIICEEAGEAMKDALDVTREGNNPSRRDYLRIALRTEIVQVAAMAILWLEMMENEDQGRMR